MAAAIKPPSVSTKLKAELEQCLENKDNDDTQFVAVSSMREIFNKDNLQQLYDECLEKTSTRPFASFDRFIEFVRGDEDEPSSTGSLRILSIIVYNEDVESLQEFVTNIDEHRFPRDTELPLSFEEVQRRIVQNSPRARAFYSVQPIFCAIIIHKGEDAHYRTPTLSRLPLIGSGKDLGLGSSGIVRRVKIAKGHWTDGNMSNYSPKELAQKMFNSGSSDDSDPDLHRYKSELHVLRRLQESSTICNNAMTDIGSLSLYASGHAPQYMIFFPLAQSNLEDFFNGSYKNSHSNPCTMSAKADLIGNACELAGTLSWLHEQLDRAFYHFDIKPDNILLFEQTEGGRDVWKLADFGLASERQRSIDAKGNSSVLIGRPPGTYQAPEITGDDNAKAGWQSDIWAFGCVLAVLYSFLDGGRDAVARFGNSRHRENDEMAPDSEVDLFYETLKGSKRLYPGVTSWFNHLRESAAKRSSIEGQCVREALTYLEEAVFIIDRHQRGEATSAKNVQQHLQQLREHYRDDAATSTNFNSDPVQAETHKTNTKISPPSETSAYKPSDPSGTTTISHSESFDSSTGKMMPRHTKNSEEQTSGHVLHQMTHRLGVGSPKDDRDYPRRSAKIYSPGEDDREDSNSLAMDSRNDELKRAETTPQTSRQESTGAICERSKTAPMSIGSGSKSCGDLCYAVQGCQNEHDTEAVKNITEGADDWTLNNYCEGCGKTPLHHAILNRSREHSITLLKILLKHPNIDVNAKDNVERTPFNLAIEQQAGKEQIKVLLDKEDIVIEESFLREEKAKLTQPVRELLRRSKKTSI